MKPFALMLSAFLALSLSACAVTQSMPPVPVPSTSPLTSPLSPVSPLALPPNAQGLSITFERSGGLAGARDVWRFYPDGRVQATTKAKGTVEAKLPDAAVSSALERIASLDLLSLNDSYMPANTCCDRMTYKLTIDGGAIQKTITTMDGADRPADLDSALQAINSLIQESGLTP